MVNLLTLSPISKQWCFKNVYNPSNSILHEAQTTVAELGYQSGSSQGHHWAAVGNPYITSSPSVCWAVCRLLVLQNSHITNLQHIRCICSTNLQVNMRQSFLQLVFFSSKKNVEISALNYTRTI